MTADEFIATWKSSPLNERQGAQSYFNDLCDLLGVEKPRDPENYCFERGAKKSGGGGGWADVWKRGHFSWEDKKPGRNLDDAYKQLSDYTGYLGDPPLRVVCDRERIIIHTVFPGYPDEPIEIRLEELRHESARQTLRWVFTDPEKLRPEKSNAAITEEAAREFAAIAEAMRQRGIDGAQVAHFLVQCLFAMFAEDERLLPAGVFTRLLERAKSDPAKAVQRIDELFRLMQKRGGNYGDETIAWFNGGLFKTVAVPPLTHADLAALHQAALRDWRAIDPTIFGTLFERGLDAEQRVPLGAHYTDTATMQKLIEPLIVEPLRAEWEQVKIEIASKTHGGRAAKAAFNRFLFRLNQFRVLDPACGSGNFLYLSLAALRNLEKQAHVDSVELGLTAQMSLSTGPHNVLGLEVNEFAAELARVTVWIGDIQWCRRNKYEPAMNPILRPLEGIAHQDALLNADGSEAEWPPADVIVGNPPFLGDKAQRGALGTEYVNRLRCCYKGRVPGGADLVCYWFEKARAQIESGQAQAAGLVATNSIRGGANRKVLDQIRVSTQIFEAWSDEAWANDGAAVRVSLVGFGKLFNSDRGCRLNDLPVTAIHADLTAANDHQSDLTSAKPLAENENTSYLGIQKTGPFDVSGKIARSWLNQPNPHGRPNSEVVKPWFNGLDITRRQRDMWIVDFGTETKEEDACMYEQPFAYIQEHVYPVRVKNQAARTNEIWWLFHRPRPSMRKAIKDLPRFIVTPEVSKHRVFVVMVPPVVPDKNLTVIARSDDTTFGILHSRFHEIWSLRMGTSLEDRPRYTPTTTFETFPFPAGLTPADTKNGTETLDKGAISPIVADELKERARAIADAAYKLNTLRNNWLNPKEWVEWVITPEEQQAGFPSRPIAKPGHETALKQRTLTNLYNKPPAWLTNAHRALDITVAQAYGWEDYTHELPDDVILQRLLALNLARNA